MPSQVGCHCCPSVDSGCAVQLAQSQSFIHTENERTERKDSLNGSFLSRREPEWKLSEKQAVVPSNVYRCACSSTAHIACATSCWNESNQTCQCVCVWERCQTRLFNGRIRQCRRILWSHVGSSLSFQPFPKQLCLESGWVDVSDDVS